MRERCTSSRMKELHPPVAVPGISRAVCPSGPPSHSFERGQKHSLLLLQDSIGTPGYTLKQTTIFFYRGIPRTVYSNQHISQSPSSSLHRVFPLEHDNSILPTFLPTAITASTLGAIYRAPPIDLLRPSSREQARDLPSYKTAHSVEDGRQSLPALDPISRPSSTVALHHSTSLPQLPSLSTLASLASSSDSPQLRAFNVGSSGLGFSTSSPSATSGGGQSSSPPTCQNCTTSTTPLWRRDEIGSVLCNACGLFLKLHGRPRPISLKTDVIKSRNRVKSSGSAQGAKKKSLFDSNGLDQTRSQAGTPPLGSLGHRRTSQKSANGHSDGSNSPISRTATPSMYGNHLPAVNGHSLDDHFNHHSPSLPPMHLRQPSPGRSTSPLNGAHGLEVPQTYEQLIAQNSSLKTRVSELEVINELFRGRVTQLEQDENNARRGEEMRRESEHNLLNRLEESQRRENQLKRRLDDVERELSELRDGAPRAKKMRVADMVGDSESSTPPSVT